MRPMCALTEQEYVVLSHVAMGQRNAEIADELSISIRTVSNHLYHIFDKLGVSSRTEAVIYALYTGLLSNLEMSRNSQDE